MKCFLAVIAASLAVCLAGCFGDLGGEWFPPSPDAGDAGEDAGHPCEDHGGKCSARAIIGWSADGCGPAAMRADYSCAASYVTATQCCVPRPTCEAVLVGLARTSPRCVPLGGCPDDDLVPQGDCQTGICCSPTSRSTPPAPPPPPPVDDAGSPDATGDG